MTSSLNNSGHICSGCLIGEVFGSSRQTLECMTAIAQVKLLISLAQIDGMVADREKSFIWNIARASGLDDNAIGELFHQRHELIVPENLSRDEKFDYLFSLVKLMKIDERMYKEELLFVSKIGAKLGYDQAVLGDLMLQISSGEMSDEDKAALREQVSKYLS